MRDYVFINEDGTVNNILHLVGPDAIAANDDLKDLLHFDYTEWAPEDKPAPSWTYNKDTEEWNKILPFTAPLPAEQIVEITEPAADELLGGN